jgi:hypothetical protein
VVRGFRTDGGRGPPRPGGWHRGRHRWGRAALLVLLDRAALYGGIVEVAEPGRACAVGARLAGARGGSASLPCCGGITGVRWGGGAWCGPATCRGADRWVCGCACLSQSGGGQLIGAFVVRVTGVTLDPVPLHLVRASCSVQAMPQVGVLDRLLASGLPAVALPPRQPLGDAVAYVGAVGVQLHDGGPGEALQRHDRCHQLHAVVGGLGRLAATDLLSARAVVQDRAPSAWSRITAAGTVGVDVDHAFGFRLGHGSNISTSVLAGTADAHNQDGRRGSSALGPTRLTGAGSGHGLQDEVVSSLQPGPARAAAVRVGPGFA